LSIASHNWYGAAANLFFRLSRDSMTSRFTSALRSFSSFGMQNARAVIVAVSFADRVMVSRGVFHLSRWLVQPRLTAVGETPCERAPAHGMLAKNRRVYAGDFPSMAQEENIMFRRIKQLVRMHCPPKRRTQPQPEEDLGGGDICSLQEQPSTDDDQPLD
jgi:hypothetical protein